MFGCAGRVPVLMKIFSAVSRPSFQERNLRSLCRAIREQTPRRLWRKSSSALRDLSIRQSRRSAEMNLLGLMFCLMPKTRSVPKVEGQWTLFASGFSTRKVMSEFKRATGCRQQKSALGVELDMDQVEAAHQLYSARGPGLATTRWRCNISSLGRSSTASGPLFERDGTTVSQGRSTISIQFGLSPME